MYNLNSGDYMRFFIYSLFTLLTVATLPVQANTDELKAVEATKIDKPLFNPFVERYILDDLKQLRQEQHVLREEMIAKMAESKLDSADRAIRYTADTTNNIFYIITAAASIFVLFGWRSIKEMRDNIRSITQQKVEELTLKYEQRLNTLENTIKKRSDQIVENQKEISDTNLIHSLWMRAGLEKSDQEKLKIYDQILEINSNDIEALTYKADTLLDMGEDSWALSLATQALEENNEHALAYWQSACAKAKLNQPGEAVADIQKALEFSSSLKEQLDSEPYFESLKDNDDFKVLMDTLNLNT
jgi:tetratricopeptide (TPR) repeat protein